MIDLIFEQELESYSDFIIESSFNQIDEYILDTIQEDTSTSSTEKKNIFRRIFEGFRKIIDAIKNTIKRFFERKAEEKLNDDFCRLFKKLTKSRITIGNVFNQKELSKFTFMTSMLDKELDVFNLKENIPAFNQFITDADKALDAVDVSNLFNESFKELQNRIISIRDINNNFSEMTKGVTKSYEEMKNLQYINKDKSYIEKGKITKNKYNNDYLASEFLLELKHFKEEYLKFYKDLNPLKDRFAKLVTHVENTINKLEKEILKINVESPESNDEQDQNNLKRKVPNLILKELKILLKYVFDMSKYINGYNDNICIASTVIDNCVRRMAILVN
jgi:hypothetical protein